MPKVIRVWFGFALLRLVIGLKKLRHFLDQSAVKAKPIIIHSHTFSRALRRLHVFTSRFDSFTGLSVPFVIGQVTLSVLALRLTQSRENRCNAKPKQPAH